MGKWKFEVGQILAIARSGATRMEDGSRRHLDAVRCVVVCVGGLAPDPAWCYPMKRWQCNVRAVSAASDSNWVGLACFYGVFGCQWQPRVISRGTSLVLGTWEDYEAGCAVRKASQRDALRQQRKSHWGNRDNHLRTATLRRQLLAMGYLQATGFTASVVNELGGSPRIHERWCVRILDVEDNDA